MSVMARGLSGRGAQLARWRPDGWVIGTLLVAGVIAVPLITVIVVALRPADNIWPHLAATVLPTYALNTFVLMAGVAVGVLAVGIGTAWLVTMCRFPYRRTLEWALILPIAMPAYVIAYVYTDLLEFSGPVQGLLRDLFGWSSARDYWFPDIRTMGGAIAMFTLVFYPYVYVLARSAFVEQSIAVLEVSRTLGRGPWRTFWSVALPLARPSIAVGLALALMETLNDFGTVDYFAVSTFTRGIFNVWFGMNNVSGAAQIASLLLLVVLVLIVLERASRGRQRYRHTFAVYRELPEYELTRPRAAVALAACLLPVLLGFIAPGAVLAGYAVGYASESFDAAYAGYVFNSLALAAAASVLAVIASVFLAYAIRLGGGPVTRALTRFASVGYAVPGAVLAIGILIPFGWLDNTVDGLMRTSFGISTGLLLSGTVIAATYAYVVRFLAVSFGSVEASFAKVSLSMDHAARTLGATRGKMLRRVHLPLVRGSALAAALLVFVDVMKELPMTLILRPFDFDTLATHVYQFAGDEQLERSALAALTIVAAGIVPVILLSRAISRSRPGAVAPLRAR